MLKLVFINIIIFKGKITRKLLVRTCLYFYQILMVFVVLIVNFMPNKTYVIALLRFELLVTCFYVLNFEFPLTSRRRSSKLKYDERTHQLMVCI